MTDEPEQQTQTEAEDEAGDDGEIKGGVFAAMDDVAGEAAEAEWKSCAEIKECAEEDEEAAKDEERAAEFAERLHAGIVPEATEIGRISEERFLAPQNHLEREKHASLGMTVLCSS